MQPDNLPTEQLNEVQEGEVHKYSEQTTPPNTKSRIWNTMDF